MLERLSTRGRIFLLVTASSIPAIVMAPFIITLGCDDPNRGLVFATGAILVLSALVTVAAWYGAERLALAPIRAMLEVTRRVRGGDLSARTGATATGEELSQLGAALDAMAEQLQAHERELRAALDRITKDATTDALTGLYNRRFFWDALGREFAAARRKKTPFSVIMLDIDRFKHVNDTFGHDAGDVVLVELARLIERSVRESDIAVRYGGEEFAILLPETSAAIAAGRAERLRQQLEGHDIRYGGRAVRVTASFGVAEFGPHAGEPGLLLKAADDALYAAKATGRNRVVVGKSTGSAATREPAQAGRVAAGPAISPALRES